MHIKKAAAGSGSYGRLLACTLTAFAISGIITQPLGIFIPYMQRSYGFSYEFSGLLLSAQSAGNLIAGLIAGILPLYLGRRRSILILSMWMAAAFLIFVSGMGSPALLAGACFMMGISRGGNSNFANTMISTLPAEKSAAGFNMLHGCFALGALSSPLIIILMVQAFPDCSWRAAAALFVIISLVQLAVYSFMPIPETELKSVKSVDRSFLHSREFRLSAIMLFFYLSAEYALLGWMVTYFQDAGILSPGQSQLSGTLFWLLMFFGRLLGAGISGKVRDTGLLLASGACQFVFFLLMLMSKSPLPALISLAGVAFSFAPIFPTAFSYGSKNIRGSDLGCSLLFLSGCAGGILTPAAVGFISDAAGIRAGMVFIAVISGLLLLSAAAAEKGSIKIK